MSGLPGWPRPGHLGPAARAEATPSGPAAPLVALALTVALVATACVSSSTTDTAESTTTTASTVLTPTSRVVAETTVEEQPTLDPAPGELIWIHDREPADLHVDDPDNGADIAAWIRQGMLEGLFGVDQTLTHYPELLASSPTPVLSNTGRVTIDYELRDGLTWSDGEPLTADDVAYTHRIIVEGCEIEQDQSIVDATSTGCEYELANRIGYDLVTSFEVTSPTTFTVRLASFYPGWRDLYPHIYAEHAFGADAAAVNANLRRWQGETGTLPSSGPLVFGGWERGIELRLVRNDAYHGSASPDAANEGPAHVESVRLAFVTDRERQITLLEAGEAHVIMTQPHPDLAPLASSPDFTVAPVPGPFYEHWGLNLLNPHLARPGVREAIAYALDKRQIVAEVYQPLLGASLPEAGLGNAYWMPGQAHYEDHQSQYDGANVAAARAALEEAGYTTGSDGVWTHPTDGRLSLRLGTTAGNHLRDRTLELGQAQLAAAGIEVTIDSAPGGLFLAEGPLRRRGSGRLGLRWGVGQPRPVGHRPVRLGLGPMARLGQRGLPHGIGGQPVRVRQPRVRRGRLRLRWAGRRRGAGGVLQHPRRVRDHLERGRRRPVRHPPHPASPFLRLRLVGTGLGGGGPGRGPGRATRQCGRFPVLVTELPFP